MILECARQQKRPGDLEGHIKYATSMTNFHHYDTF